MKKLITIFMLFGFLFLSNHNIKSQSLEETLSNLSSSAGSAYVEPIISAFGSNLNAGWVSAAPPASKFEFTLNVKFIALGSFFTDDQKRLNATGSFRYTADQVNSILANSGITQTSPSYNALKTQMLSQDWEVQFTGPTIIGKDSERFHVFFEGDQALGIAPYDLALEQVKGYLDEYPALPSVAAQLNVGTILGTQASFRWFPDMDIQELGKFSFFGFGLLHNPEVWLNDPLPVDIAAGFFTQSMKVGSIFESTATQYGVWVSKTFGSIISFSPYVGLTMETSKTEVAYDYVFSGPSGIEQTARIGFELEGENKTGVTVGAAIKLIFLDLTLDYKMAKTNTASVALSFGL